jgi:hypothetical protein
MEAFTETIFSEVFLEAKRRHYSSLQPPASNLQNAAALRFYALFKF